MNDGTIPISHDQGIVIRWLSMADHPINCPSCGNPTRTLHLMDYWSGYGCDDCLADSEMEQ